jgi:hypothetical protein
MAVAAGTLRQRQKQEAKLAAKSKRDKIILAVGGVLLVLVLLFEIPKVMKSSGSSAPPAPAPTVGAPAPAATSGVGVPSEAVVRKELAAIAKLPAKDPFQPQLGDSGAPVTTPSPTTGPRVRLHHFVLKNPFKAQVGAVSESAPAAPLAKPPAVTPAKPKKSSAQTHAAATPLGYIVILRSLDTKASALQEVKRAHGQGLLSAAVLYSSKYTTLRHGYWVVYLSKYPTPAAANAGLQQAHAHGYASAYRRPVKK